ncbi:MAG: outer membrane protein assembly factor BamD [Chloracidobacterium sp.]|nr:outer membrane protein assembly factor BamD [Chloracidobacterium sp.]
MKKKFFALAFIVLAVSVIGASAQRNVTLAVDPILEADAKHNLDVARQAFTPLKQAYKQVIFRFEETYAAYPEFTGIDEFLYMAGMSSYYLSANKGKQKVNLKAEKEKEKFAPEKLKADAIAYLSTIVDKYPDSKFVEDAKKTLAVIKVK